MNKLISVTVIAAMVLVALAAFALPASAQGDPGAGCAAVTKYYNGTMNGSIYFEQQGYSDGPPSMTKTFTNVPDGIKIAKVYTGVWGGSPCKGGDFNITINNAGGVRTTPDNIPGAMYRSCDPCPTKTNCGGCQPARCDALRDATSGNLAHNQGFVDLPDIHDYIVGCGVHFISYNATPYIIPGSNTITVQTRKNHACNCPTTLDCGDGWDGRIYVIALMVIYESETMPEITYWVNEGALYLEKDSECDGPDDHIYASKYFNGTNVTDPTRVSLWSLGFPHVINTYNPGAAGAFTKLNGIDIGAPGVIEAYGGGANEVLLRWNLPPNSVNNASNFLEYNDPEPYYERAFAEVLIVHGPSNKSDLNGGHWGEGSFPVVMRPNKDYTINKTVENIGGGAAGPFNVSLDIAGTSYHKEVNVTTGLGIGSSTTVSFDDVNLPKGCYNFIVTKDCNGDVTEDNEFNNVATKEYQVGNVIVVDGNSDFERLDVSGDMALPAGCFANVGGTYYIRNLDIENCAEHCISDGVHITNTTVPFVIRNCTIHDCEGNGVYFNNVTNGKVNESEIYSNGLKGIRMENCSYVTIETNSVHDHEFGVDVYMDTMPYVDSHHVTISNNTVSGGMYGIEVLGNDCTVRCNTIEDTTGSYAVYVSGNYSVIHNNTMKDNAGYGIQVDSTWIPTLGNLIYGNDFIGNNGGGVQAFDSGTNTGWNTSTQVQYYYDNDGTRYNYTGNYWSDYYGNLYKNYLPNPSCTDLNGDGIGDSIPYAIGGGAGAADNYPMVVPWWVCGDVNGDGRSDTNDLNPLFYVSLTTSQWAGDVNCQGSGSCLGCVDTNDLNPLFYGGNKLRCCPNCCDGIGCCTCIGCCCNPT